jgi:hypothetical protein
MERVRCYSGVEELRVRDDAVLLLCDRGDHVVASSLTPAA